MSSNTRAKMVAGAADLMSRRGVNATSMSGDSFALSPPLIVEKSHIDDIVSILGDAIKRVA